MASAEVNVHDLQEAMQNLLNSREQAEFLDILNDYYDRRDIQDFSFSLRTLLDTPAKQQLLILLRRVMPRKEIHVFDNIIGGYSEASPKHRMLGYYPPAGGLVRATSTQSVPNMTRKYQVTPTRSAKSLIHKEQSSGRSLHLPKWEAGAMSEVKRVMMEQPRNSREGLGFSIRGGAEHGIGIYVSYVDVDSHADRQGLVPGDQILTVNGQSFHKMAHKEAAKLIKNSRHLDMEVRNVGRVPGSFETHQTYTWVDALGRNVSPPPEVDRVGRYDPTEIRKSGLMLLKDSDERKVNVVTSDNKPLGLTIRGGNEFGLGIYVTGVDRFSVAENAGLKVGDQVLDVNGQSFLDISHADAVRALKSSRHLMLTIKDVGRLPYARTTYDSTQWLTGRSLDQNSPSGISAQKSKLKDSEPVFKRGAGSQLMHSSVSSQQTQRGMIEEQARQLLNDSEHTTMTYYLSEYEKNSITVDALLLALFELLNTQAKFSLVSEVRGLVTAKDIERFDTLVLEQEARVMKGGSSGGGDGSDRSDSLSNRSTLSSASHFSTSSIHGSDGGSDLFNPMNRIVPLKTEPPKESDPMDEDDPLHYAIEQINTLVADLREHDADHGDVIERIPEVRYSQRMPPRGNTLYYPAVEQNRGHPRHNTVEVEVHHRPASPQDHIKVQESMRSPSEDSGVEMNGGGGEHHPTVATTSIYEQNWNKLEDSSKPNDNGKKKRVTLSSQDPVIINEVINNGFVSDVSSVEGSQNDRVTNYSNPSTGSNRLEPRVTHLYPRRTVLNPSPLRSYDNLRPRDHSRSRETSRSRAPSRDPSRSRETSRSRNPSRDHSFTREMSRSRDNSREPLSRTRDLSLDSQENGRKLTYPTSNGRSPWASKGYDEQKPDNVQNRSSRPAQNVSITESPKSHSSRSTSRSNLKKEESGQTRLPQKTRSFHEEEQKSKSFAENRRTVQDNSTPPNNPRKMRPSGNGDGENSVDLPEGRIKMIVVEKAKPTLGIAIEGGADTRQPMPRIINIQSSGSAAPSGLKVGQVLLEVNSKGLRGLSHQLCARAIAEAFKSPSHKMELLVLEPSPKSYHLH